jgi:phospholipid-binding lipoprotein MlaA
LVSRRIAGGLFYLCALWCLPLTVSAQGVDVSELKNPEDPWEGFNRKIFAFNDVVDRYIALPIATAYAFVTPEAVDQGVTNFFKNLLMPVTIVNDLLQLKFVALGSDTGRFFLNSTVGVFGVIDVATLAGLEEEREDFGQTMGYWGVKSGPYLVLPFLGGVTVRDGIGILPNYALSLQSNIGDIAVRNSLLALEFIDIRADLIPAEQLITGDRYIFLRDAYLQQRRYLVADGEVVDDFGDGDSDDDFDDFDEYDD